MQRLLEPVSEKKKKTFYIIVLLIFSILFNQYYGYKGIYPIDSFFPFNSGYDILNGFFPFKDYWTRTSPFIDLIQALFFKILGVYGLVMFFMLLFLTLYLQFQLFIH